MQRAQHTQRPRGGRDCREQRGNQLCGVGHRERAGASEGPVAWSVGSGPASPLGPQPAARSPQGPPRRSQARPALAVVARPAGASNGPPGPSSGEWSPAALMCGRPARRQLVPPRRPRARIDTHQAAGGRERPLPRAPLTVFRGPPRGWWGPENVGGRPPGYLRSRALARVALRLPAPAPDSLQAALLLCPPPSAL